MNFRMKARAAILAACLSMTGPVVAQTSNPVNIGVLTDMSGLYSAIGGGAGLGGRGANGGGRFRGRDLRASHQGFVGRSPEQAGHRCLARPAVGRP